VDNPAARVAHRHVYLAVAQQFNTADIDTDLHKMMRKLQRSETAFGKRGADGKRLVKKVGKITNVVKMMSQNRHRTAAEPLDS
jgi:hypothetical protein